MRAARATLKDVAAHAGVSHQTVSNVLNDHPSIRPEMRERVLHSVRALDYQPNHAAKALREARVTTVCCAFYGHRADEIADPYRNLMLAAFVAEANLHGYSVTVAFLNEDQPQSFTQLRHNYRQRLFDGAVLVGPTVPANRVEEFMGWGLGTVLLDHELPGNGVTSVSADYAGGMREMVRHHAAQGRRRLALILPEDDVGSSTFLRRQGFLEEVARLGLTGCLLPGDWSYASGERAMRQVWAGDFRPDALLGGNDRMAAGALRAAYELGLQVPRALAISGYDDFDVALYTTPWLTTIHVPHADMARASVRALLSQLGQQRREDPRCFPVSLVVRESA